MHHSSPQLLETLRRHCPIRAWVAGIVFPLHHHGLCRGGPPCLLKVVHSEVAGGSGTGAARGVRKPASPKDCTPLGS
jgi:hypothetical protein